MISEILLGGLILSSAGILNILQGNKKESIKENKKVDYYNITLEYVSQLTVDEILEYIDYNYKLNEYKYKIVGTCGSNDKFLLVKHIAELADQLERPFDNRFSRY